MTIKFNFERTSEMFRTYCVSWQDDTARYHVWAQGSILEDVIHKNPLQRADGSYPNRGDAGYFPHRALDGTAAANAAVMGQIRELIKAGALDEADLVEMKRRENAAAEIRAIKINRRRSQLLKIAEITGVVELQKFVERSTDDEIHNLRDF